ncbi:LacI family DNA-binding transcriptional regulator [Paenibacillus thalictri]|uniref:LacI family transcriptional regulator n=1 Tax=Paenibacillus thalictri TaxID=2527873 RepID=A0A4Q9DHF0_9BACL|nr:LacI family DNA-binding transcriptional regulator [Paenibacillus thalictri]TBL69665.1 LacI family transcriptional regulator [Paenibacillus thalictri]
MNTTISDLARITGLAKSTISGVLNNKSGFSEKTRQKVLKAAEEHGYVPNEIARGLSSRSTGSIGLIIKDITNPFYNHITKGVQEIAREHGYTVFLCSSGEEHDTEIEHIEAMVRKRVDGLIIAPLLEDVTFDHIFALQRQEVPFVLLGKIPGLACDTFAFDDYDGGRQVTEHMLANGHTRIGFVCGLKTSRASKLRYDAFIDVMNKRGLPVDERYVFREANGLADGQHIGRQLAGIDAEDRPTALICFDDVIAIGVIRAFIEAGLNVPDDLSIVGFDDIDLTTFPLTSVSIPTYEAGKALGWTLFDRIFQRRLTDFQHIMFDQKLVVRTSVKNINP